MSQTYLIGPTGPRGSQSNASIYERTRRHDALTIFNIGDAVVLLDDEPPLGTTSDGIPLGPGSSIPWDADRALYATCATSTTIVTSSNSGIPFDAGAVAEQILDQGLAQDIANAISITGAPPIDRYTQILASPFVGLAYTSAYIDVSTYSSINIRFTNGFPTRLAQGKLTVMWYSSGTQPGYPTVAQIAQDEFYFGTGVYTDIVIPVKGAQVVFGTTGSAGNGRFDAYGSYKTTKPFYLGEGFGSATGTIDGSGRLGVQTWSGAIPATTTTWLWQPDTLAGRGNIYIRFNNAGTVTYIWRAVSTILPLTIYAAVSGLAVAAGDVITIPVSMAAVPVELSLQNPAATVQNFRASYVPDQPYQ